MYDRTNFFVILIVPVISASIYTQIITKPKSRKIDAVPGSTISCTCTLVFDPNKINSDGVKVQWKKNNGLVYSEFRSSYKNERVMVRVTRRKDHVTSTLNLINANIERDSQHPWIECYFLGTGHFPAPSERIRIDLEDGSQSCGRRPLFPKPIINRIVAGVNARAGEVPWQVYLRFKSVRDRVICGGSILNSRWILTAAHCFDNIPDEEITDDVRVVAGNIRRSDDTLNTRPRIGYHVQVKKIKSFRIHESYTTRSFANDLALLELVSPLRIDDFTQPICLPKQSDDFTRRLCTVSGFGYTDHSEKRYSMDLKKVDLPVINRSQCEDLALSLYLTKTICTISTRFPKCERGAFCDGDSGGPLACVSADHGQFVLAGVVSWNAKSCQSPISAFSEVAAFLPWIRRRMKRELRTNGG